MSRPRHQKHSVANANRRMRRLVEQPLINVQRKGDLIMDPHDGRLKVIPKRDFMFNVPYELSEGKHSFEHAPNPINQLGGLVADNIPVATSNDFASFMAAFNKRSNFQQSGPKDDISDDLFYASLKMIDELPDMFDMWDDNTIDRDRWLAKFDWRKRQRMEDGYKQIPLADYKYIGTKDLSVKQEILLKRYDDEWAPRVIYAGNDCFNALTGPPAMVMMERFCELCKVTPIGPVNIMPAYKSTDVQLLNFLCDDKFTETVEGDFSRNDREQRSRVALLFDKWQEKLKMPQWFRRLNLQLENFNVQNRQFGFRAKLKYQLPTGTTNTTVRNSTYNATMFAITCIKQNRKGKALILGDDLLARLNKRLNLNDWVLTVAKYKMVLKAKAPALNAEATFLSRRIIMTTETACMVPLIGKMIARFNARGTSNPQVDDNSYMAGKSLSYAYECRHVPWLRSYFLQRYMKHADSKPVFDELSWFTRTSGYQTLDSIVDAINNEKVLVDDHSFEVWLLEFYDSDLYELSTILEATILNTNCDVVDLPYFDKFLCDV